MKEKSSDMNVMLSGWAAPLARWVDSCDALPKTSTDKVDYQRLKAMA